jgi:NAD(P)-dependent dehydrogenase (short-subunit alcohol dehydrogenase family)
MREPILTGRRLAGKAAIVTGAGAQGREIGIGRAIALVLAGEGARVACIDLDGDRAEATVAMIRDNGGQAQAFAADIATRPACADVAARAAAWLGGLDILVNNVGISPPTSLDGMDEAQWSRVMAVNLESALWMSQQAVPPMRAAGGGAIVNITSIAGLRAHGSLAYGTSKAAMVQLAREIAVAHGRDGIRANAVAPGHVMTPHIAHRMPPAMREERRRVGPLGIEGDAWDVAMATCFLASDEARFITGALLPVDGGVTEIGPLPAHGLIMRG